MAYPLTRALLDFTALPQATENKPKEHDAETPKTDLEKKGLEKMQLRP